MTLDDIFNVARDAARHPGEAMAIDDLRAELHTMLDAATDADLDPSEIPAALDDLKALREHVKVQPFDIVYNEDTEAGQTLLDETSPDAFADWLATLERLAE
tara:strand:+ start:418 stop:723 length:306 start_codon:yes stop_codon:yes gene_type:complete